ncbi:Hypothetical protein PHPALM_16882 [Phytophthora palmivora]|uniref:Uncharacterized protein n=1 Tax=Phytophthora palmivora TaxID=4796 RepID=A0A2P4XNK8_9STRA|nr:Hypothetical protein PHPALM_16882 [Phytophthora palmivora]
MPSYRVAAGRLLVVGQSSKCNDGEQCSEHNNSSAAPPAGKAPLVPIPKYSGTNQAIATPDAVASCIVTAFCPAGSNLQSAPRVSSLLASVRRSPRLAQELSTAAPTALSLSTRGAPGPVATSPSPGTATVSPSSSAQLPSTTQTTTQPVATTTDLWRYQLVIRPIIKKPHAQQERSCEQLDDVVFNGATFGDIITKIWEHLSSRMKARAVKTNGVRTTQIPTKEQGPKMMRFKHNRHLVDSAKSEAAWDKWLQAMRGETVLLLV